MKIKREVIQVKTKNGDWVSVAYFDSRYDRLLLNQLKKQRPDSYRLRTEIITIETT